MNRRWGFAAGLVVIAALAVGLAFALRSSPQPSSASVGRLTLPVPRGLNSYPVPVWRGPGAPLAIHVITNFRVPDDTTIDRVLDRWSMAGLKYVFVENHNHGPPSDAVALELIQDYRDGHYVGPKFVPPPPVQLHLPLSPNQPWGQARLPNGAPSFRSGRFHFHGYVYFVKYWIGPDAPANDRDAVLRALRSIRPNR